MRGIFDRIEGYDEDERIDYIERMGKQVVLWIINQIHQEKTQQKNHLLILSIHIITYKQQCNQYIIGK